MTRKDFLQKVRAILEIILVIGFLMAVIFIFSRCSKQDPETVLLSASGSGTFETAYYHQGTWYKTWAQDYWQIHVDLFPGDTVQLAAYGNSQPVTIAIMDTLIIQPYQYQVLTYIQY